MQMQVMNSVILSKKCDKTVKKNKRLISITFRVVVTLGVRETWLKAHSDPQR